MTPGQTRNFDAVKAFLHALKSIWLNRQAMFDMTWPWMLIVLPFDYARVFYANPVIAVLKPEVLPTPEQAQIITQYMLPYYLITVFSFASIAVIWHNYVLRDEWPQGLARLRLDRTVWRYVGNLFILTFLLTIAMIIPLVISQIVGRVFPVLGGLTFGLVMVLAITLSFRLGLRFPAIAIGNRSYTFMDAMMQTRPSSGSIVWYALLIVISVLAVRFLVFDVLLTQLGAPPLAMFGLEFMYQWVTTMLGITALTTLYGFFAEGRNY
jgi:hypothetical protein